MRSQKSGRAADESGSEEAECLSEERSGVETSVTEFWATRIKPRAGRADWNSTQDCRKFRTSGHRKGKIKGQKIVLGYLPLHLF